MGRVQDRVVIVTGGAGGIGSAACRAIAAEGGKVLVADLDEDAARGRRGRDRGGRRRRRVDRRRRDRPGQVRAMVRGPSRRSAS